MERKPQTNKTEKPKPPESKKVPNKAEEKQEKNSDKLLGITALAAGIGLGAYLDWYKDHEWDLWGLIDDNDDNDTTPEEVSPKDTNDTILELGTQEDTNTYRNNNRDNKNQRGKNDENTNGNTNRKESYTALEIAEERTGNDSLDPDTTTTISQNKIDSNLTNVRFEETNDAGKVIKVTTNFVAQDEIKDYTPIPEDQLNQPIEWPV